MKVFFCGGRLLKNHKRKSSSQIWPNKANVSFTVKSLLKAGCELADICCSPPKGKIAMVEAPQSHFAFYVIVYSTFRIRFYIYFCNFLEYLKAIYFLFLFGDPLPDIFFIRNLACKLHFAIDNNCWGDHNTIVQDRFKVLDFNDFGFNTSFL